MASTREDPNQLLRKVIDWMRDNGIGESIPLPRVIIVGEQSAGKSSVLECIFNMQTPTDEELCTRFPIEIVFKSGPQPHNEAVIIPVAKEGRSKAVVDAMNNFHSSLDPIQDLAQIVDLASEAMGLEKGGKNLAEDVLKVTVTKPTLANMTIIDLPGIIHNSGDGQTTADADFIEKMVKGYMNDPRTIILVVLSAKQTYQSQVARRWAREADTQQQRTMGILTKLDTIDERNDPKLRQKYRNMLLDTDIDSFPLGCVGVVNRNPSNKGCPKNERDQAEEEFFAQPFWKDLPSNVTGSEACRARVDYIINKQLVATAPDVQHDLQQRISTLEPKLKSLEPVVTIPEIRRMLKKPIEVMEKAVDGDYNHPLFQHQAQTDEADLKLYSVIEDCSAKLIEDIKLCDGRQDHAKADSRGLFFQESKDELRAAALQGQQIQTHLVWRLFFKNSSRWPKMIEKFADRVADITNNILHSIVQKTTDDGRLQAAIVSNIVEPALSEARTKMNDIVSRITAPWKNQETHQNTKLSKSVMEQVPTDFVQELVRVLRQYKQETPRQRPSMGESNQIDEIIKTVESQPDLLSKFMASHHVSCADKLHQVSSNASDLSPLSSDSELFQEYLKRLEQELGFQMTLVPLLQDIGKDIQDCLDDGHTLDKVKNQVQTDVSATGEHAQLMQELKILRKGCEEITGILKMINDGNLSQNLAAMTLPGKSTVNSALYNPTGVHRGETKIQTDRS